MELIEFESGGRSSEEKPAYHLFPIEGIAYGAERMAKGAASHGAENYMRGVNDERFVQDRRNHLVGHALAYCQGRTTPDGDTPLDHLKAVLANAAMLARIEETRQCARAAEPSSSHSNSAESQTTSATGS